MMNVLIFVVFLISHKQIFAQSLCQEIKTEQEFKTYVEPKIKSAKTLYFFASWCVACGDFLKKLDAEKQISTILVAYHDSKKNAEKIVSHFQLRSMCVVDSAQIISTKYQVTEVPKLIDL